jgi:3',5'-cyclic AMP phosphodiesterase CpdA
VSRQASAASALAVLAVVLGACASTPAGRPRDPTGVAPPPTATAGAVVDVDRPGSRVVYALSDVHGGYDRLAALLAGAGITSGVPERPDAIRWAAGDAVVVVTGDLIDKGPQPIEVIDALRALEASALAAGGRVVVLLGNHEAEFFVNPTNKKADGSDGVDRELETLHVDPYRLAAADEARGQWLVARPFAARVGAWFFSHGGSTHGRTLAELDSVLRAELTAHPTFDSPEIVGDGSILEERAWYGDPAVAPANARALGVAHLVFGHDPNALGPRGAIAVAQNGLLFRIDCGMSPDVDDSTGCILRVRRDGTVDVAEELRASGPPREIFRE